MKLIINYKKPKYENNKLISYDIDSKYIIDYKNTKKGGDIFDNLENIIVKKPEAPSKSKSTINIVKKDNINYVRDIKLNEHLTIFNIKELIYNLTNITIENQHIEQLLTKKEYENIDYKYENKKLLISIDTKLNNVLLNPYEIVNGLVIDYNIINNRELYVIKTYDHIKKIKDLSIRNDILELDVFNIDDFIFDKENLYKQVTQDKELLNIIYYGFVEKYFPMYNLDLFNYYLQNLNKTDLYPNLYVNKNKIIEKIKIINDVNEVKLSSKEIESNIKEIKIKIESYNYIQNINIQEIFNNIVLNKFDDILKLECQLNINDKLIYLTKINLLNSDESSGNDLYLQKDKTYNDNMILFYTVINNNKYKIQNKIIKILLDEYNNLYLILSLEENLHIEDYKKIIEIEVNKIISNINSKLNISISKINKYNLKITSLNVNVLYDKILNHTQFAEIYSKLVEYEIIDYYKIQNFENVNNKIELRLKYIDLEKMNLENELNEYTNNYYSFVLNQILIEKFHRLMYTTKINIYHRIKDIQIEYININIEEYEIINDFLLQIINKNILKLTNKQESNGKATNKLKQLKELDPVLYIINKKNTSNLYSRKCQNAQQPSIINEQDIKKNKIKDYIKYWNFTKNKPEFYTCNNKKFPYVKFLTNIHPNNYCVPCCKKKSLDDIKIKSKYEGIHNKCLANLEYNKNLQEPAEIKSRYIMNYSYKILLENNRIMDLPITLKKLFSNLYEIETADKENQLYNYYIVGINQDTINLKNIGILYILSFALGKSINELLNLVNRYLLDNPTLINNLLNGTLLNYVSSMKELVLLINNVFSSNISLNTINYEFNQWNSLFIEISKHFGIIYVVIEEHESDVSTDSKLKLLIPENVTNVSEYIYNNDNYKYVLLMKRMSKNKTVYYPICKLNSRDFYTNSTIYKKMFNYDDNIIITVKKIISTTLEKGNILNNRIYLELIEKFILESSIYKIIKYYVNKNNEIYGIILSKTVNKKPIEHLYINVENQKIQNLTYSDIINSKIHDYNPINLNKYDISYNNLIDFIYDINNYIYQQNKLTYTEIYYKKYINEIINKNYNLGTNYFILDGGITLQDINLKNIKYTYLRIQNFIIYKNKIIGVTCNNLNIYITNYISIDSALSIVKSNYNKINKLIKSRNIKKSDIFYLITREYQMEDNKNKLYVDKNKYGKDFDNYINYFKIYKYNPLEINKIILDNTMVKDNRIIKLNESLYNTNLYNLLMLHLVSYITKIKNVKLRSKIKLIISNFNDADINEIINNNNNDNISKLLNSKEYNTLDDTEDISIYTNVQSQYNKMLYNLILFIKNIIIINKELKVKELKKIILETFDKSKFEFDNIYIYKLLKFEKKDLIKEIDSLLEKHIINKSTNQNYNIINFDLCDSTKKSFYCDNNKLIISKDTYKKMLNIIYYDLTNPFKQEILLNFNNITNNLYRFHQNINEKIFIYL